MFSQQLSPSNFPQLGCLPQCHLVLQRIVIACFHPQTDIFCATSVMIAQSILCWSSAAEQKSPFTCLIGSFIRRLSKHVSAPKQMFSVYVKKMGWLNCTLAKILTDLCRATAEWYKVMCWDRSCGHMTCTYMYTSVDFCGGESFILLRGLHCCCWEIWTWGGGHWKSSAVSKHSNLQSFTGLLMKSYPNSSFDSTSTLWSVNHCSSQTWQAPSSSLAWTVTWILYAPARSWAGAAGHINNSLGWGI